MDWRAFRPRVPNWSWPLASCPAPFPAHAEDAPTHHGSGPALEVARLVEGRYADCARVTLVADNLNIRTMGAFHGTFELARARDSLRCVDFRHTPNLGSWLKIEENKLSGMTRQCAKGRRIGDLTTLNAQIRPGSTDANTGRSGVDRQMKIDDARRQLNSIYPQIPA